MPTYQYACTNCDEQIEVVQRFSDDPLTECPACAGRLRKVFSPVGVVFKGSGFYRTDSRNSTKTDSNGAAKSSESNPSTTSASGSSPTSPKSTKTETAA